MQPLDDRPHSGSFWDHLGQTRADEYAAHDELADLPIPARPGPGTIAHDIAPADGGALAGLHPHDPPRAARQDMTSPGMRAAVPDPAPVPAPGQPQAMPPRTPSGPMGAGPMGPRDVPRRPETAPRRAQAARGRIRSGRLAYRLQRLWLTPLIRRAVKIGLPGALVVLTVTGYLLDADRRAGLAAQGAALYALVVDRPEFMVSSLHLPHPVPPELEAAIREVVTPLLPISSFRLDLAALRAELERLDAIRLADLRLTADGALSISVTERVPAILWRSAEGLEVLDAEGVRIGFVTDRAVLPHLPLVAGEGADAQVAQALALFEAATPLSPRVLGLVHVGQRRWDVVLDRDQVLRLPELGALHALERLIALDQAQDMLARDIQVADLRNPTRPVLQVSTGAIETIRALRGTSLTESNSR